MFVCIVFIVEQKERNLKKNKNRLNLLQFVHTSLSDE